MLYGYGDVNVGVVLAVSTVPRFVMYATCYYKSRDIVYPITSVTSRYFTAQIGGVGYYVSPWLFVASRWSKMRGLDDISE